VTAGEQLKALLPLINRFPGVRIGVLGDLMVDRFIYGDARRLSPEAPVPVVKITRRTTQPGGAANVANNVLSMGGQLALFGVLGEDAAGHEVREMLAEGQADLRGVILDPHRLSTVKTRLVAQSQQVVRFDEEETGLIDGEITSALLNGLRAAMPGIAVLVISDYAKGLLNQELVAGATGLAHEQGVLVVADPKPANIGLYRGVDVLKPNMGEALRLAGSEREVDDAEMPQLCREVRARSGVSHVMITAGARGMFVLNGEQFTHIPAHERGVYDVAGAGDTVLAALALALACGAELHSAAVLGNLAGSIAVGRLGIAAVTAAELKSEIEMLHGNTEV
jgi:D-beta-D-heptose 7-phosphate kinase/D-beta-D-heptose 1-phosphate adenosyltransferase